MSDHRSKLSRKKAEAIAALLAQPTVADAAREAGISHQKLLRWLNHDAEFDAAYRAAKRAEFRHSMVRLGQGATAAVKSIIQIMYKGKTPAMRLTAARAVIRLAAEANEMEDQVAAVVEAQRLVHAARTGGLPKGRRGRASITAHGAKFPRKKEKAIAALLVNRESQHRCRRLRDRHRNAGPVSVAAGRVVRCRIRRGGRRRLRTGNGAGAAADGRCGIGHQKSLGRSWDTGRHASEGCLLHRRHIKGKFEGRTGVARLGDGAR